MKNFWLTATMLMGLSSGALAATPWPLAVFLDNPQDGDSAEQYRDFSTLMGQAPVIMNAYTDFTQSPSGWLSNSGYSASEFQRTPGWTSVIPMIDLPMGSTNADAPSTAQILTNFANGTYDSMMQGMVQVWKKNGYSTQYWRPGVEMNLVGSPGFVGSDRSLHAQWVAAFKHIYTTMHAAAAADGVLLYIIWNPGLVNGTPAGNATKTMWPGKNYVDIIGGDVYGEVTPYALYDWAANGQRYGGSIYDSTVKQFASNPINLNHFYSYPASNGSVADGSGGVSLSLLNLIAFAEQQGLPIGICETGAGGDGPEIDAGLSDNPYFPAWQASVLKTSTVPVKFVSIWDDNGGGDYAFTPVKSSGKPKEAAAWAANFGAEAVIGPYKAAKSKNK